MACHNARVAEHPAVSEELDAAKPVGVRHRQGRPAAGDAPSQDKFEAKLLDAPTLLSATKEGGKKYTVRVGSDAEVHDPRLSLDTLRRAMPSNVFRKQLWRSLCWLLFDMAMVLGGLLLLRACWRWEAGGLVALKALTMAVLYLLTGFFMWGLFVVAHDCGHGSFSDYPAVNFLCGVVANGAILVPFSSWARSHRFHHLHHNHVDEDYSFSWSHDPQFDSWASGIVNSGSRLASVIVPIFGFPWYLLMPQCLFGIDGSHYLPGVFKGDRMWKGVGTEELIQSWISVFACLAYLYLYTCCPGLLFAGAAEFWALYVPSLLVFTYLLFTVTYLQHHSPETKVYDNTTWRYATAAFETVDRTYGSLIDFFHHHISDCHVIHHIFFTKIPHYHLPEATEALKKHLESTGLQHLYKFDDTLDFYSRVFSYMYRFGNRGTLFTKKGAEL